MDNDLPHSPHHDSDTDLSQESQVVLAEELPPLLQREALVAHLRESIQGTQDTKLADYVTWVKGVLLGQGTAPTTIADYFAHLYQLLQEVLPNEMLPVLEEEINQGLKPLITPPPAPTWLANSQPLMALANDYLNALLDGDRTKAERLINQAVEQGTAAEDIYLYVFQSCQEQIGLLWQAGSLSVDQEHYCTTVTSLIMSHLQLRLVPRLVKKHTAVIACVNGNKHDMGARMVAHSLEIDGWNVVNLGPDSYNRAIVEAVNRHQADVLALSVALPEHLLLVPQTIREVRASPVGQAIKIMLGGNVLNRAPDHWIKSGADGYASTAQEAVAVANYLVRMK